jgi:hypothetical protein
VKLTSEEDANAHDLSVISGTLALALVEISIPEEDVSQPGQTPHVPAGIESGPHDQLTSSLVEQPVTTIPAVRPLPFITLFA